MDEQHFASRRHVQFVCHPTSRGLPEWTADYAVTLLGAEHESAVRGTAWERRMCMVGGVRACFWYNAGPPAGRHRWRPYEFEQQIDLRLAYILGQTARLELQGAVYEVHVQRRHMVQININTHHSRDVVLVHPGQVPAREASRSPRRLRGEPA